MNPIIGLNLYVPDAWRKFMILFALLPQFGRVRIFCEIFLGNVRISLGLSVYYLANNVKVSRKK